jgi:quercetin dioxygenase-like cupin family protein
MDHCRVYDIKIRDSEVGWIPLELPGVSIKVLNKDESTGATAVLTRIEAGAIIPAHFHSRADETVYVLNGDFIEDGVRYGPGSYFAGKAGTPHGPHETVEGCILLTHFSAELDFQVI